MKILIPFLLLLPSLYSCAQNYKLPNEEIILEFETTKGKKLVVAIDSNEDYLVYRYGSTDNIELQFPEDLTTSWNSFQHSWYLRGGGTQNEGMDLDYLYFDRGEYRYVVFQEYYSSSSSNFEYGIKVINTRTDKRTVIEAKPSTVKGTLSTLRDIEKVKEGEELFE